MNMRRKIAEIAAVSFLLIGIGFASSVSTRALAGKGSQGRNWDGYPNWGGSYQLRQTALNAGYNEGSKEGRKDRDKNRHSDYRDFAAYQNATKDYSSKLGDRELYRRYFRTAFENGYETENQGSYRGDRNNRDRNDRDRNDRGRNDDQRRGRNWDRYGSYGGSFQLRQTALNAGYNAGIKQGRDDGKRGRHRSYSDFSAYRNATDDYSSKLGDRELYRRYYREGFGNGYEDGYRGY